jgi:hypothetical protein
VAAMCAVLVPDREQIAEGQRLSREWLETHPPGGN